MRYGLMAVMTRMIIQGPIFRYVEESMPQIDQRQFKKNTIKEFHAIIRRTPSIGGSKNPFQMTVMFAAFAIAAYKAAQPVINDELFIGMVDAVSYCDTMKKLYVGKDEFSRKNIASRRKQAEFTQTHDFPMDWKTEFTYVPGSGEHFMYHTECGVCKLAEQEGVPGIVKYMCKMDYAAYDLEGVVLDRTKTIGWGDECCNFHVMTKELAASRGFVPGPDNR